MRLSAAYRCLCRLLGLDVVLVGAVVPHHDPHRNDVGLGHIDIELLDLEIPVVVTATRREEKITKLPYAISVVTREEIRRSGA